MLPLKHSNNINLFSIANDQKPKAKREEEDEGLSSLLG